MRLDEVLSPQQYQLLLDEDYIDNGNWIPAVDGKIIPAVTVVVDEPPEIQLSNLKQDARRGPVARLGFIPDKDYMIRLSVPTQQQSVLSTILGRGATILDQAAANTNNTVGDPVSGPPATVQDAIFGIFKVNGTVGDFDIEVPRLPHADFPALKHYGSVGAGTVDHCISVYDTVAKTCREVTNVAIGGAITWVDKYIGNIIVSSMVLSADRIFNYDPATSGLVTIGSDTVSVDGMLVDPELRAGDLAAIFGFSYTYSQLDRASDWQVTQPLQKPTRVVLDLYRSLSDVPEFRVWERRRYYYCEQFNLPAASTDGSKTDPNLLEYAFVARYSELRLGGAGRYYDKQFLVDNT